MRAEAERAREICIRQLATRPRTRAELTAVLTRREIPAEVIESVLARYDEVGMIDDAAFAREWVATRHRGRGLSRRALADELRRKGVDKETAGAALDEIDPESEEATAFALAERKVRVSRGEPDAVFRRVVGMLARKGYPAGLAIRAVKAAMEAKAAEAEDDGYAELAGQIDPDALADSTRGDSDPL
ncbi:regulatory protein RecX [Catenuloplanes japonicus]|uniref:regulatory protein RecX n=1 Tax=Catenuloplanes japonicus TaxID=33876 RepID=UPI000524EE6E|nr:regulatory protein RecX [Catenuloplanes japonicus]